MLEVFYLKFLNPFGVTIEVGENCYWIEFSKSGAGRPPIPPMYTVELPN